MKGLTGVIKFDHQGFRSDFTLDIIELTRDGLQKAGIWNSTEGVNYTRSYGENQKQIVEILQNKTLVVTTILVSGPGLKNLDAYLFFGELIVNQPFTILLFPTTRTLTSLHNTNFLSRNE